MLHPAWQKVKQIGISPNLSTLRHLDVADVADDPQCHFTGHSAILRHYSERKSILTADDISHLCRGHVLAAWDGIWQLRPTHSNNIPGRPANIYSWEDPWGLGISNSDVWMALDIITLTLFEASCGVWAWRGGGVVINGHLKSLDGLFGLSKYSVIIDMHVRAGPTYIYVAGCLETVQSSKRPATAIGVPLGTLLIKRLGRERRYSSKKKLMVSKS